MVQLKLVLDTRRKKSDGTFPITFRITDVKKVNYIPSGVSVIEAHWDENNRQLKKVHPNAQDINAKLSKKYYEIQKAIIELQNNKSFSFEELKALLNPKKEAIQVITFYDFTQKLINELLELKRPGNAIVYKTAITRFTNFTCDKNLPFSSITYDLLEAFKHQLAIDGVKINTISNYLRALRAIFNKGIKSRLIERSASPFFDLSIKTEKTAKRALAIDIIKQIENLPLLENSPIWHARNYFMLSYYLIGISFTDLAYLKASNISEGRIELKRRKTHKQYTIKIFDCTYSILSKYPKGKYLLPVIPSNVTEDTLESKKVIYQWIKTTNKYLKVIGTSIGLKDPLTSYVARHTWATNARRLGYSKELIAAALGHEEGNRITDIYLDNFDSEIIDKMHEAVIK